MSNYGDVVIAPQTAAAEAVVEVEDRSVTLFIVPGSGVTISEADKVTIKRSVSANQDVPQVSNGTAELMGSTNTSVTLYQRGTFKISKALTAEAQGINKVVGFEEVK